MPKEGGGRAVIIPRGARRALQGKLGAFPAVLLLGPRQCGKTTLLRRHFPGWRYLDLERPSDADILAADPEAYLEAHPSGLIIDEAQRLPGLWPVLRSAIDRKRRPGRFILSGSSDPALVRQGGESLAGRLGIVELSPFSARELHGRSKMLAERWFFGGYPPLYALKRVNQKEAWLEDYTVTFIERDIPFLGPRISPIKLRKLWQMLAHVHGGLLSLADLARSLDMHYHSVSHYLDVLESAFLIRRLQPFFANISKRLVKSPKLYIRDTGLLHYLAGLRSPRELESWPRRGASWEGLVLEEIISLSRSKNPGASFYFWRTHAGAEVDLLIDLGHRKIPIEIKSGASINANIVAGLRSCLADLKIGRGWVIYGGSRRLRLGKDIEVVPWTEVIRPGFEFK
ncbi:MAG TPA: ATP-binding protein [Elusimicrobiota bacterium]|nr:ATP-binding protein [Elusimicrobiota bacterium]